MPKSKLRGGAKAHKKRVIIRNQALNGMRKKAQAEYTEMFEKKMEEFQAQYEGKDGTVNIDTKVVATGAEDFQIDETNEINVTDVEVVTPEVEVEN